MEQQTEITEALKNILRPYAKHMNVTGDSALGYSLNCKMTFRNQPLFFAAVKPGKAYVSFHLMPIYMNPKLQATISPELKKRMQGKSCFNFKKPDPELFKQLNELTKKSYEWIKDIDWPAFEAQLLKKRK